MTMTMSFDITRFLLGQVVATPSALVALERAGGGRAGERTEPQARLAGAVELSAAGWRARVGHHRG